MASFFGKLISTILIAFSGYEVGKEFSTSAKNNELMPYVNSLNAIKDKSEETEHFTLIMIIFIAVFLFFATIAYFGAKFCTMPRNNSVAPQINRV